MPLNCGIVGLPNVGKSTIFNALTSAKAQAANYPFCTIDPNTGVVVLEYASQGRAVRTGAAYSNRYVSVITVTDRKVTRWRDYLDPIAVFDAVGWPPRA